MNQFVFPAKADEVMYLMAPAMPGARNQFVFPAKAGTQVRLAPGNSTWTPAYAGATAMRARGDGGRVGAREYER